MPEQPSFSDLLINVFLIKCLAFNNSSDKLSLTALGTFILLFERTELLGKLYDVMISPVSQPQSGLNSDNSICN